MARVEMPAREFRDYLSSIGYRRRTVVVVPSETVTLMDLNWYGGTRSTYTTFRIGDYAPIGGTSKYAALHPSRNHAEGATISVPVDHIVIQHGHFCGKVARAHIYVHPSNMPALLAHLGDPTPRG